MRTVRLVLLLIFALQSQAQPVREKSDTDLTYLVLLSCAKFNELGSEFASTMLFREANEVLLATFPDRRVELQDNIAAIWEHTSGICKANPDSPFFNALLDSSEQYRK